MKKNLILSLGSNIEPRDKYLKRAIEILNRIFKLKLISSLYKTKPLDDKNQQDFFNICVNYETDIINPLKILHIVKDIEKKIGRKKII
ncbi:MAG: 2-amino-4-hydroxy-6-hydroxymethyldihydropteridine diphosphokinase, partial [Spirochaetes bacterium]|nr:2-amino-4-hydroxy-6-hydroxymethyldihydropteridine diphosphokinase [Spirochaetota bacterium]